MEHTCEILSSRRGRKLLNWHTCEACLNQMMENAGIETDDYNFEIEQRKWIKYDQ